MAYTHKCIKPGCDTRYSSDDPDPYYCEVCDKQRLEVAKTVDTKIASRPRKHSSSELQDFMSQAVAYKKQDGTDAYFLKTSL